MENPWEVICKLLNLHKEKDSSFSELILKCAEVANEDPNTASLGKPLLDSIYGTIDNECCMEAAARSLSYTAFYLFEIVRILKEGKLETKEIEKIGIILTWVAGELTKQLEENKRG